MIWGYPYFRKPPYVYGFDVICIYHLYIYIHLIKRSIESMCFYVYLPYVQNTIIFWKKLCRISRAVPRCRPIRTWRARRGGPIRSANRLAVAGRFPSYVVFVMGMKPAEMKTYIIIRNKDFIIFHHISSMRMNMVLFKKYGIYRIICGNVRMGRS